MKSKIIYILAFIFVLFGFNTKINALENSGVLQQHQKTWLYFNGTKFETSNSNTSNPGYPNFSYKESNTTSLICETGIYVDFAVGETCSYDSANSNAAKSIGVAYLINDFTGNPGGKQFLRDSYESYYWLELSGLYYLGNYKPETGKNFMNNVYDKITLTNGKTFAKTQEDARAYQNEYAQEKYTKEVKFNFSGESKLEFTASADGYYYSQKIHVVDENGNAVDMKISLDNNSFELVKQDGYYLVKIAESKITSTVQKVTLTVTGGYEYYKAQFFDCSAGYQDVISTMTTKVSKTGTNSISGEIGKTGLTIKKVDKDGNILPGAQILVESETNDYREEFTTTDKEIVLKDIPYGEYSITELSAPEGYIKSNEIKKVTISQNHLADTVVIQNSKTKLIIRKFDENNEPLADVVIKVESKENNYSQTFTTTINDIVLEGLKYGEYIITEESTVQGYILLKEPIKVQISETNPEEIVEIQNILTKLQINKVDKNKKYLKGAMLELQDKDGNILKYCTDENGNKNAECRWESTEKAYEIEGLPLGKYYLVETKAPEGYALNTKKIEIEIDGKEDIKKVNVENKLRKVVISKINSADKKLLKGATLEIQDEEGNIVKYCTDEKGNKNTECKWESTDKSYEIIGMPIGKYYLVETKAPEGFELNTKKIEFEVKEDKEVIAVEMENQLEVKVPDTLSSRSALLIAISMFDIALGIGIVTYVKKHKTQE